MGTSEQNGTASGSSLQGWKDIAGYLGRSVRAVQRWERELGLPVRRIKTAEGQTVYAFAAELDEWRRQRDSADPVEQPRADDPLEATPEPLPSRNEPARRTAFRGTAVTLVLVTAAFLAFQWKWQPARQPIVKVRAGGSEITAQDAFGNVVWRYPAGEIVSKPQDDAAGPPELFVDLDGDGTTEVVVAVRYAPFGDIAGKSDAVMAFSRDGELLWRYQPDVRLDCGSERYGAPWRIYALTATAGPHPRVFVAINHSLWWPGLVMELTSAGSASLHYLQNGWVRGLKEWSTAEFNFLAVTGVSNELERPTVALLSQNNAPASAPTQMARFHCTQSPSGRPAHLYALPNIELLDGAAYAFAIGPVQVHNNIFVDLAESSDGVSIAELSADLHTVSLSVSDTFWARHRLAERERRINHSADSCPEVRREQSIALWDPKSGWSSSPAKINLRR